MIVAATLVAMDDYNNPRTQSHAALCMVNFCESGSHDEQFMYHADNILFKLITLMSSSAIVQQSVRYCSYGGILNSLQALQGISGLARAMGERFHKYYSILMPKLMAMVTQNCGDDVVLWKLQRAVVECAGYIGINHPIIYSLFIIIGAVVPRDEFLPYAKQIIEIILLEEYESLASPMSKRMTEITSWPNVVQGNTLN